MRKKKILNHRAIKTWIRALKSGEYRQTRGFMFASPSGYGSFCCLGVLTNEYCLKNNKDFDAFFENHCYPEGLDFETEFLPVRVQEWTGLHSIVYFDSLSIFKTSNKKIKKVLEESHLEGKSITELLAAMNDAGVSFKQIAKFLEDNLDVIEQAYQDNADLYGDVG